MNGAQALIRTLVDSGVDVCFTNPGTSEMHFVAALDTVPEMRGVLGLFEGVVTGAADGYGRMAGRPAATLLHLGPGLGNGLANLHNARRASHAGRQRRRRPRHLPPAVRRAAGSPTSRRPPATCRAGPHVRQSPADGGPGRGRGGGRRPGPARAGGHPRPARRRVVARRRRAGAARRRRPRRTGGRRRGRRAWPRSLRSGEPCAVLVGGAAPAGGRAGRRQPGRRAPPAPSCCARPSPPASSGAPACPPVERLGYLAEFTMAQLAGTRHLVLVDARSPVSFFAYPDKPSDLVPEGCEVHVLAGAGRRRRSAPSATWPTWSARPADAAAPAARLRPDRCRPAPSPPRRSANALGALLPEGAIVSDEANTAGLWAPGATAGAPRHDWLTLCGGAIGQGLPAGHRRGGRLPRPQGGGPRGRRQRHVHAPGAVDPGPRGPRRHHGDLQQPLVRHPQPRAQPGRRRGAGPEGARHARPRPAPTSTSWPSPRAWASPATRATTAEELTDAARPGPGRAGARAGRGRAARVPVRSLPSGSGGLLASSRWPSSPPPAPTTAATAPDRDATGRRPTSRPRSEDRPERPRPPTPSAGPYAVGLTTVQLADRVVEVLYPAAEGDGHARRRHRACRPATEVFRTRPASDEGPFPVLLLQPRLRRQPARQRQPRGRHRLVGLRGGRARPHRAQHRRPRRGAPAATPARDVQTMQEALAGVVAAGEGDGPLAGAVDGEPRWGAPGTPPAAGPRSTRCACPRCRPRSRGPAWSPDGRAAARRAGARPRRRGRHRRDAATSSGRSTRACPGPSGSSSSTAAPATPRSSTAAPAPARR